MTTINVNNPTVTIITNDEQVGVKTSDQSTKGKGLFENRCSEIPLPEPVLPSSDVPVNSPAMFSAVRGMASDIFKQSSQGEYTPWHPQVNPTQQSPFISHFNRLYPVQRSGVFTQQQSPYHTQMPTQQINTFKGYPANPNYHPPHHPVGHEPKGKSTGDTDQMLLPTLRSIPQSKIGYTTSGRPCSIKDIFDTEMNTWTVYKTQPQEKVECCLTY